MASLPEPSERGLAEIAEGIGAPGDAAAVKDLRPRGAPARWPTPRDSQRGRASRSPLRNAPPCASADPAGLERPAGRARDTPAARPRAREWRRCTRCVLHCATKTAADRSRCETRRLRPRSPPTRGAGSPRAAGACPSGAKPNAKRTRAGMIWRVRATFLSQWAVVATRPVMAQSAPRLVVTHTFIGSRRLHVGSALSSSPRGVSLRCRGGPRARTGRAGASAAREGRAGRTAAHGHRASHDAAGRMGPQPRRRLLSRQLPAAHRLLEEARLRVAAPAPRRHRQDLGRPADADGDHHVARESPEARSLQDDLQPPRQRRGADRRRRPRARQGGQGRGVDRRRPARHRNARRAAADRARLADGQPHRRRDAALPGRRDSAVRAGQPGRDGSRLRLVHEARAT